MTVKAIPLGDILEETDERLGQRPEPEVLTLTEKNGFLSQRERFNKRLAVEDTSDYKVVRRFDIAFNPYLLWAGAVAQNIDWDEGIVSPLYPTFRPRTGYEPRFVDRLLRSPGMVARYDGIAFGSVPRKRRTSVEDFLALKISEPPAFSEQWRIAEILDKADSLRAKRRVALAQLDTLTQSIFLDMFGDPLTNPKRFPIKTLAEFYVNRAEGTRCGPFGSALKKSELVSDGIPVWNMDNIDPGGRMVLPFRMWVSEGKYRQLGAYAVADGDVIVSRAGTVGKMCVVRTGGATSIISTNLIRLRFGPELLPLYFVSLMTFCKGRVGRLRTGEDGAFTHMNTGILDTLKFPYPPFELQRKFAVIVESIERQKSRHSAQLAELELLLTTLQQCAFQGQQ
jgi:type I restriction enzyme S subunit